MQQLTVPLIVAGLLIALLLWLGYQKAFAGGGDFKPVQQMQRQEPVEYDEPSESQKMTIILPPSEEPQVIVIDDGNSAAMWTAIGGVAAAIATVYGVGKVRKHGGD